MKTQVLKLLVSIACVALPSLAFAADSSGSLFETIKARKQLWAKLYNAEDATGITAMYTSDATVIAPNYGPAKGHAEIQAGLEEEMALGHGVIGLETLEVSRLAADAAYEIGYYTLTIEVETGDPIVDEGHYVIVWKLDEDKVWRIHVDTWNTSLPLE